MLEVEELKKKKQKLVCIIKLFKCHFVIDLKFI